MNISLQYRNGGCKAHPRGAACYSQTIATPLVHIYKSNSFNISQANELKDGPRLSLELSAQEARVLGYQLLAWAELNPDN